MKIYFEKFGDRCISRTYRYLTAGRPYEVVEQEQEETTEGSRLWAKIEDDEGDATWIELGGRDSNIDAWWRVLGGTTRSLDVSDAVASLESERNALANSIDSVNELLDSLAVPKAETLVERVASALTPELETAGTTVARIVKRRGHIDSGCFPRKPVRVSLMTESGEVVYFRADLDA